TNLGTGLATFATGGGRAEVAGSLELVRLEEGEDPHRITLPADLVPSAIAARAVDTVLAVRPVESAEAGSRLVSVDAAGVLKPWADLPASDVLLRLVARSDGSLLAVGGYREGVLRQASQTE